jgi:4'-phosphopantetheinyl transferase
MDAERDYYWNVLDDKERNKALRFVHKIHRDRYVASHGKLRVILASYIGIAPENIRFAEEEFGKPYVSIDGKVPEVKFNLSHSGYKMIVAVGLHDHIGVDVEEWNDKVDCGLVSNSCFAETERSSWNGLQESGKDEFFYRLWTRKESFVKAVGVGIGLDVSSVVSSTDGAARFLSVPAGYGRAEDWALVDFDFGCGISAALTVPAECYKGFELRLLERV